ncbi:hypothetical protein [Foetidibacter luteolus]|uniref:hypothetical protein n=1 Tax=Foetidibacter luteolus TaxID=2608880 RepID=UPI00129A2ADC|nr:hypothetical protein [Foetidibacter luteolus]
MINPFALFHREMIPGFIEMKRFYLVSQTNKGAFAPIVFESKTPILLSDYENLGLAKIHFNAITNDRYRAILDLTKDAHKAKLYEMLSPNSKYVVYSAFIQDERKVKNLVDTKYCDNIRRYLSKETNWRIDRKEILRPDLELIFGELFVTLKWSGQTVKLRLADIEKY